MKTVYKVLFGFLMLTMVGIAGGCGGAGTTSDGSSSNASPTTPTGLQATQQTASSVILTWNASSGGNGGVYSYTIYKNGAVLGHTSMTGASGSPAPTTYTSTNLSPSTAYIYTVSASDLFGNESAKSSAVQVGSSSLTSLAVTPVTQSLTVGAAQQLTATGTFSDNSTGNLTSSVTWRSSSSSVASISAGGMVTAVGVGTVTITATSGTISKTTTITVSAISAATGIKITSFDVSPKAITPGQNFNIVWAVNYNKSTHTDGYTFEFHLNDSNQLVAGFSGLTRQFSALGNNSVSPGITENASLTCSYQKTSGGDYFTCQKPSGGYYMGTTLDVLFDLTKPLYAIGKACVTENYTQICETTVTPVQVNFGAVVSTPTLTSISVTPTSPSLAIGATQQLTATGTYSDSSTKDLTSTVTWNSSSTSVATISAGGKITAVASGTSTFTATSGAISGASTLTSTTGLITVHW